MELSERILKNWLETATCPIPSCGGKINPPPGSMIIHPGLAMVEATCSVCGSPNLLKTWILGTSVKRRIINCCATERTEVCDLFELLPEEAN
ncbi:MAG: hypothetical protein A2527_14240 [Candidatus Lambdaproteobacteria bacterium RIFOXYD2_FULL_50_16]|uniref:Uncharacterized protein n=1 Tax=Candidatus Lambdaproteobacteria bacterium RIFOXYD2_FULL_50_16 TaxID=1817772 RepID=A0A1F6G4P2_9PROT|nr:MAG: hypothetical protein A2527_14240 [Candidatus Lambdaproteobacteria bacterium RIFOXYD2_FULL_50_16]